MAEFPRFFKRLGQNQSNKILTILFVDVARVRKISLQGEFHDFYAHA